VLAGEREHALERVRDERVVGVEVEDELAASERRGHVAGPSRAARAGLMDDADVRMLGREAVEHLRAPVGRAVVDRDDLEVLRRQLLHGQRLEAPEQLRAAVVDRQHDADRGHAGLRGVRGATVHTA